MKGRRPTNVSASVSARLLNQARSAGEDYNALLARYAAERFLYRLGISEHNDRFLLKGAMLFILWEGNLHRMTRDLDLLGRGSTDVDDVVAVVREICTVAAENDGVTFHADSVRGERIREDMVYEGVRVRLLASLGTARIPLQIDLGFGDVVNPDAQEVDLPTLLEFPRPRIKAYPRYTVVAEKVHAMVFLGMANSRMKDFYDVAYLAHHFDFSGQTLVDALRATFDQRKLQLPDALPLALTDEFALDTYKQTQWRAFLRRAGIKKVATEVGVDLPNAVARLRQFLEIPLQAARSGMPFPSEWTAPGPWVQVEADS